MKKNVLICFLGIDGSGKSTLSRYLFNELKERKFNAYYTWWLEGENSLLRRLLRKIGKSKHPHLEDDSTHLTKINIIKKRAFKIFYPWIVLIDYLRFGLMKTWLPYLTPGKKIIVFDRFFYDTVLALSNEFNFSAERKERLIWLFNRFLPKPDLLFIIQVTPETAYERKKEEIKSIENAMVMADDYQKLFSILGNLISVKMMKIDNSRGLDSVKTNVLKTTLEFLKVG